MFPKRNGWILFALTVGLSLYMTDGFRKYVKYGLAVMSVDLGSEFMKVAIVKPGVPMEIVLNKESGRKTPTAVSMRNGERLFSDGAKSTSVRFPKASYIYFHDLLAKGLDNPVVKRYQERFPFYEMGEDPDTKTVYFKHSEEENFTIEELLAMLLEHAKEIAEKFAEQPVYDAVITVPPYFNQAERRAMLRAGEMAGIKVLQIMNDNTAVALNYGVFRRKSFNATAVHYLFLDMGATSTSATVVAYQEVKNKNKITGTVEKDPQVTVKGVGFNRNLGGLELQLRLRDLLATKFNAQKKTSTDVTTNPRAMAKLFKEAGRLKHVLSANTDHFAQIEGLLEDVDFKVKVTRDEFEEMCADLFEKVGAVVEEALKSSEVHMDEIKEVILMGGGTRVPKVQQHLQKAIGREELGKSINTDEAAALGAVYQAAHLSKGFKVKKFIVKEATIYPIQVEFERAKKSDETGEVEKKMVARTLFGRNNPYPQNKVMTFNKHKKDFEFEVNYGDMEFMTDEDKQVFGGKNLFKINLSGVAEAYDKHKDEADSKGIKAHFKMENSGMLEIDKVEFVFEKQPAEAEKPEEEKSTLEKLGSAFSGLFGGSDTPAEAEDAVEEGSEIKAEHEEEGEKPVHEKQEQTPERETSEQNETKEENDKSESGETRGDQSETETKDDEGEEEKLEEDVEKDEETTEGSESSKDEQDNNEAETPGKEEEKDESEQKTEEKTEEKPEEHSEEKPEEKSEEGANEDKKEPSEEAGKEGEEKKKPKKDKKKSDSKKDEKPKIVIMREDIKSSLDFVDQQEPSKEAVRASKKKIKDLKAKDEEKQLLEKAKNDLETFIIDAQDKLYQDDYVTCSTEENREEIQTKLSKASDWLYEQEDGAGRELYVQSLKDLKKATKKLWERVQERRDRPKAIEALNSIMNYSAHFLFGMKNFTGEEVGEQPFTKVEYETLENLVKETKEWNDTIMAEQAATPDTEKPKVLMEDFGVKIQALDREIKYLTNKAKTFRPKVKKEDTNSTKTETPKTEEKPLKDEDMKTDEEEKSAEAESEQTEEVEQTDEQQTAEGEGDGETGKDEESEDQAEQKDTDKQDEEVLQLDGADGEDLQGDSIETPTEKENENTAEETANEKGSDTTTDETANEKDSDTTTEGTATENENTAEETANEKGSDTTTDETANEKDSDTTTEGTATHNPEDL